MKESNFETTVLSSLSDIANLLSFTNIRELVEEIKKTYLKDYILDKYKPYYIAKAKKMSSIRGELTRLMIIVNHPISEMAIEDIKTHDIELFLISIEKMGRLKSTVNRYRARLHAILNYAINNDIIVKNVVTAIKRYKEYSRDVVLSEDEIKQLLLQAQNSRNKELYLILMIALNTGMRHGEILNLRKENLVGLTIVLFDNETKSGYQRTIPINDTLREQIEIHLSNIPSGSKQIFKSKDIRVAFANARKRAGLRYFRIHDLRRTFATKLKDKDVNLYDLKELLGHCSIAMTEKYLTTSICNLAIAVNKIAYR